MERAERQRRNAEERSQSLESLYTYEKREADLVRRQNQDLKFSSTKMVNELELCNGKVAKLEKLLEERDRDMRKVIDEMIEA